MDDVLQRSALMLRMTSSDHSYGTKRNLDTKNVTKFETVRNCILRWSQTKKASICQNHLCVFSVPTVESRYDVIPGGREKIRCNDSTLYPDREFSIT